jgi:hypothetical protein
MGCSNARGSAGLAGEQGAFTEEEAAAELSNDRTEVRSVAAGRAACWVTVVRGAAAACASPARQLRLR